MDLERAALWRGSHRDDARAEWDTAWFILGADTLEIRSATDLLTTCRSIPLCEVDAVDELSPFDRDPAMVEIRSGGTEVFQAVMPREHVQVLCVALAAAPSAAAPQHAAPEHVAPQHAAVASERSWWSSPPGWARLSVAAAVLAIVVAGAQWRSAERVASTREVSESAAPSSSDLPPTTTSSDLPPTTTIAIAAPPHRPEPSVSSTTIAATSTTNAPTGTAPANVQAEATAIAPLTGLHAPVSSLERNAIVSKIDASPDAMPQVGLELADIVYEVKIEWGSRYLAVWHSQVPAVIGPHRSARTSDPDLLAMFGNPLFAFSGANPGVVQTLAWTTWKTGVGPGEVPDAWFRDEQRPFPSNLFASTDGLRARPAPPVWPTPVFDYHAAGGTPSGAAVQGFATHPGVRAEFRWDPALGGWHRRVWGRDHVHHSGAPVAPKNVVVLETSYGVSWADANSPETQSLGAGRAWVFTGGTVRGGTWARWQRTDPWNLRDAAGAPLTLDPGTSWVVLAEGQPEIWGR